MASFKKILIIEEDGFSKICSAILHNEGYQTRFAVSAQEAVEIVSDNCVSLIVSSYSFVRSLAQLRVIPDIPTIVLSDELSSDLIDTMKYIGNSVCLLKPLDFDRFKYIVHGIVNGYLNISGGNIIA
jgi:DNA-binding NtrC family response regulator